MRGDNGHCAAQQSADLVTLRQGNIDSREQQRQCGGTESCEGKDPPAAGAATTAVCRWLRRKGCVLLQTIVDQRKEDALCKGDDAVDQELQKRHFYQKRSTGQGDHGLRAPKPDTKDDAVQRQSDHSGQTKRAESGAQIPAQQEQSGADHASAQAADALFYGLPKAFALQTEQGQNGCPEDAQHGQEHTDQQGKDMIPGIGTDHTHDIFRYSQLRNIVGN